MNDEVPEKIGEEQSGGSSSSGETTAMNDEIVRVWIENESSFWAAASTLVAGFAAIVALVIAVRSILKGRAERRRSLRFLKKQIYTYLQATRTNYVNYFEKLETYGHSWESTVDLNKKTLEFLFQSAIHLDEEDLQAFMKFVLYFKGCPVLDETNNPDAIKELGTKLDEIIAHFEHSTECAKIVPQSNEKGLK